MKRLDLQKCIVGSVFTNCYFLKNKETEEMLIVDPGDNADRIEQKVLEMQGRPVAILLTHGHFDHILAAEEIKKKYNIPIYACAKEEKTLQDPRINLTAFHMSSYTLKADALSYGSSDCGTGRFFGSDDRDSRTYVRKLLLLFER